MTTTAERERVQAFLRERRVLLAPMAGVTDEALRALCIEQGADLTYTEMVSAKALSYANEKTRHLLTLAPGEERVVVQLFGHEPETMAREAAWVEETLGERLAYLDINMGCPARKIAGKGDGSALMCDTSLASQIVQQMCAAVDHAVTVKFRRGFKNGQETAPEFARAMEAAGAAACAVHGRFAEQMYMGQSDRGVVGRVKSAVEIPVIGNGDVFTAADALELFGQTGCDSILVARGAQGNPWIFSQIKAALAGEDQLGDPTIEERIAMARRHARMLAEREGRNIVRMRKHAMWYMHGLPGAAAARGRINSCVTLEDFDCVFDELLERAASAKSAAIEDRNDNES